MTAARSGAKTTPRRHDSILFAALMVAALAFGSARALAADETVPESGIRFVASNLLSTADGAFHDWRITDMSVDLQDQVSGWVEVEVDLASVDTGIERRDEHLRTADFFDVETYPTAKVRVYDVRPDGQSETGDARYEAKFDLDLHGVQKTIVGRFEVASMAPPVMTGSLELNRRDFGIGDAYSRWNPMSVREQVEVRFTLTLPVAP
jgi:polyisoprenoid-binding protein YceI